MSFIVDKQTLTDLNLTGRYKPDSIFNLFNRVNTAGGEKLLEHMFHHPLSDESEINKRTSIFGCFQRNSLEFPLSRKQLEAMENYINGPGKKSSLSTGIDNLRKFVLGAVVRDEQYNAIQAGVQATTTVLKICRTFFNGLNKDNAAPYIEQVSRAKEILNDRRLAQLWLENAEQRLPFFKLNRYDHLLKHTLQKELQELKEIVYDLDVCIAVASIASTNNFCFANALPKKDNAFDVAGLFHPALSGAVKNDLSLRHDSNLVFLTGANMAGKSTLMKSFGIAVYLAHMGFPVAASRLEFSVKDGIYSSINMPDNLSLGYSHFYAEVLRVKKVAEEVNSGKDLVVIFDELFKGTNVKDAYDATLAVTEALSAYRRCLFIISTHIIEVGEVLKERCSNIRFSYLPTIMDGTRPVYTYKLNEGITADRQGMIIIENEGILDILMA